MLDVTGSCSRKSLVSRDLSQQKRVLRLQEMLAFRRRISITLLLSDSVFKETVSSCVETHGPSHRQGPFLSC